MVNASQASEILKTLLLQIDYGTQALNLREKICAWCEVLIFTCSSMHFWCGKI